MAEKRKASSTAADATGEADTKKSKGANLNEDICSFLFELADHEKNVIRNINKYNIYRKAATSIAAYPKRIECGKEARKLNGVGEKIAAKIDEFLTTGKLNKLEKIHHSPEAQAIQMIASIHGFGPAAAHALVLKGVRTIEDLKKEKLNAQQTIGLRYHEEFSQRIPRDEMDRLKEVAFSYIAQVLPTAHGDICGSYRRGAASSGDIDVLITMPEYTSKTKDSFKRPVLSQVVEKMKEGGFVTDVLSCGDTKFMGVALLPEDRRKPWEAAVHRRIDIRLLPHDQYPAALLYFTGSDELNKEMRRKAIEMGFRLNEYTLVPMGESGTPGEPFPVTCERDIFDFLDMKYLEPHER